MLCKFLSLLKDIFKKFALKSIQIVKFLKKTPVDGGFPMKIASLSKYMDKS